MISLTDCPATCSDDLFIKLWNVPDEYKNFATLRGHEHSISSVCFLGGDAQVVSSSRDHTVRLWDVQTRYVHFIDRSLLNVKWSLIARSLKPLYQSLAAS
jgi:WD40 repeat protein